tara:strand:+ start:239 stop:523 length:285 start_codon:yes stop_codon:yes gene_type:complete
MSYLSESFDSLEIQVKEIIKIKQNLQQENKELGLENENLQKALEKCQSEIEELKERNKILRIAGSSKSGDNREVKLKINEIVREVDKCIAQLNQ